MTCISRCLTRMQKNFFFTVLVVVKTSPPVLCLVLVPGVKLKKYVSLEEFLHISRFVSNLFSFLSLKLDDPVLLAYS